jgi:hypothetical protein
MHGGPGDGSNSPELAQILCESSIAQAVIIMSALGGLACPLATTQAARPARVAVAKTLGGICDVQRSNTVLRREDVTGAHNAQMTKGLSLGGQHAATM